MRTISYFIKSKTINRNDLIDRTRLRRTSFFLFIYQWRSCSFKNAEVLKRDYHYFFFSKDNTVSPMWSVFFERAWFKMWYTTMTGIRARPRSSKMKQFSDKFLREAHAFLYQFCMGNSCVIFICIVYIIPNYSTMGMTWWWIYLDRESG